MFRRLRYCLDVGIFFENIRVLLRTAYLVDCEETVEAASIKTSILMSFLTSGILAFLFSSRCEKKEVVCTLKVPNSMNV